LAATYKVRASEDLNLNAGYSFSKRVTTSDPNAVTARIGLNGNINPGVADHELGHNLGLRHAGTLDCGTQIIGGSCTRSDYGDPFDVMGNASANHHYSANHKAAIGYLAASSVKTVTSGAQTLTLTSSEQSVAGATQLINVQAPNGTKYGIEKRSSFGTYDQGLGGVWIRQLGLAATDDTPLLGQDIVLWNTTLGKKFLKGDKGEIRLTASDVLEQNRSVNRSITESYVQDSRDRTLTRYVQAVFTYTFSAFPSGPQGGSPMIFGR
jgi:hypothetical protein